MAKDKRTVPPPGETIPPEEPTAIVPTADAGRAMVPNVRGASALAGCQTSLDLVSLRGRALLLAARSAGDIEFDAHGIAEFVATDWAVFADEAVDPETGEVSRFVRTVFFTSDGSTYRTSSEFAPRRLADMFGLFGPEEWALGLPIVVQQRRSPKTGRTYHDIRVDPAIEDYHRDRAKG